MPYRHLPSAEQADFLRLLIDSTLEGFYAVDREGRTTMCNKAFLGMLGYADESEVIGRKLHGEIHHSHPDGTSYEVGDCPIYRAASGGQGAFVPFELFFRRDGSSFPVEYRAEPIVKDGEPHGAVCTFLDITEKHQNREAIGELRSEAGSLAERIIDDRKRVETELQRSRQEYQFLFDNLDQAFAILEVLLGPDGRPADYTFREMNRAFERQSGLIDSKNKSARAIMPGLEEHWVETYGRVALTGESTRFVNHAEPLGRWFDVFAFRVGQPEQRRVAILFSDITEQRRKETALRESEASFRHMANHAPAMLWVTNADHQAIFLSQSWYDYTGQTEAEGLGLGWLEAVHPEDRKRSGTTFRAAAAEQESFALEYRLRGKDGGYRWAIDAGKPLIAADGTFNGYIGNVTDIDDRKRIENELAENVEHLRLAQEAGGIGVFSVALEDDAIDASPEFRRIFGVNKTGALTGGDLNRLVIPEDAKKISTSESRSSGEIALDAEYRIRRANDGALRWIARRAHFVDDEHGRRARLVGVAQDITEKKLATIAVEESRAHLSLMLESAQDFAIISTDGNGDVVSWNSGAERVFGYASHEVIGTPMDIIFTPEDRAAGAAIHELRTAVEKGRASDERWHLRKNGERFYASGIMAAMRDEQNGVTGFIKIAREMTREQQAQEALVEARNAAEAANIAKTEFLANMSHEIRTPMNAIIGLSNILGMSQPLTAKQKDFIKTLQMSADSLLGLINDLLDISKIEARSVELEHIPFSVAQLIQEVVSMMAVRVKEKGLVFTGDAECVRERMFMGDPTRLRQIVLNLCSNAIKFTETGGVHVSITCKPHSEIGRETVCISVRDTGIGIAPEKIETIFQKFVQADSSISRKYGGTGLGLAITKTLAEIMGGTIHVESVLGDSSTFKVCLPLEIASNQEVAAIDLSLPAINATLETRIKPRILLIEDYAPNVMVATNYLEQFGYVVEVAENGLEGFEKAKSGQYIAALMDVQMHGMNGFEATKLIREHEAKHDLPRLPIIGMTAHALAGDRERCLAVGMDDYISKPFYPDDLRAKLLASMEG